MQTQISINELFSQSGSAMLLADDDRRYVDANPPACDLLGLTREQILDMKIEDISPPDLREQVPAIYAAFIEAGSQSGPYTLVHSDGTEIDCSYSASANVLPGIHLTILIPVEKADPELDVHDVEPEETGQARLTDREREVLTMLALGESNATIAKKLHLSSETVRSHTRSARLRLGAKSRSHAIALALDSGQLDLNGG
jgi:PAS domain S-box-containing protein